MSKSAVDRGNDVEDDCPLCLEPMPPFWDDERRVSLICCGKDVCKQCMIKTQEFLDRARAEGSFGKEEAQLGRCCPLCRTKIPPHVNCAGKMTLENYEKGQLPLALYPALGKYLLRGAGGIKQDTAMGIEILMLGAEKGDPGCQFLIGTKYTSGTDGVTASPRDAKRWLLAATEQGHATAEFNLAMLLGEEGNDTEFLRYMRSSASKGFDDACYNLGRAHFYGYRGLQKSTEEAIRVLTPAVERGDAGCMRLLGIVMCCSQNGRMEPPRDNPNFTRGMHWIRRAVEKGDEKAILALGELEKIASSRCFRCNKPTPSEKAFLRCSRCRAAWYCSKDCQVQHWKTNVGGHKQFCTKWCPKK